jgi:hypothetical protein
MRAKIQIPSGWRRVGANSMFRDGDHIFRAAEGCDYRWDETPDWYVGEWICDDLVIRKISKK